MQRLQALSNLEIAGICSAFAGACGSLSYALKVEEGHKFRWSEFFVHVSVSAVFGLMTFEVLDFYYGLPAQVAGAACGMAGWMGTRLARILEILVAKKLGLGKKEKEE